MENYYIYFHLLVGLGYVNITGLIIDISNWLEDRSKIRRIKKIGKFKFIIVLIMMTICKLFCWPFMLGTYLHKIVHKD